MITSIKNRGFLGAPMEKIGQQTNCLQISLRYVADQL